MINFSYVILTSLFNTKFFSTSRFLVIFLRIPSKFFQHSLNLIFLRTQGFVAAKNIKFNKN